ncbi:hypothetical protein [Streptomyces sp. NPDC013489]|uniref:hypothetical protein n=1 Tax=Streptomyces sp. NPDC013489 TaxID=3155606 RepID=UPI0033D2A4D1
MTKRTTEQRRARELQRTAREQGTDLGYHEALNWVWEAAETQARFPDMIAVPVPHDLCVMIFKPDTHPEVIRRATTPISEAERELQDAGRRPSAGSECLWGGGCLWGGRARCQSMAW